MSQSAAFVIVAARTGAALARAQERPAPPVRAGRELRLVEPAVRVLRIPGAVPIDGGWVRSAS